MLPNETDTAPPRGLLEALHAKASPKADELVSPNTHGLPYIRLDEGPMKGGSAGIWSRLREVSGVQGVAMRDMRHFFAVACLSHGIPISTVSAWMGHSEIDLTVKRYGRSLRTRASSGPGQRSGRSRWSRWRAGCRG